MLTPAQIQHYRDQGYLLASGIFSVEELDRMEAEFDGLVERRLRRGDELDATWKGNWKDKLPQTMVIHSHDMQKYSAVWSKALLHDRLTEAFADLLGTPNVQLHHCKLFQKPPEKGSAFPMHQDYPYFPHARHSMMAGIIHLTDATDDMGCVRVMPASHKLGPLACADEKRYLPHEQYPIDKATPCPARRGDVLFFNYLTIHGSGINSSPHTRKTALIQVRDPEDPPTVQSHAWSNAQGMMLRGIDPLTVPPPV